MKKLNIMDIHRSMNERKNKITECFDRILEKCHRKILQVAKQNQMTCFFEVPDFMLGYPLYDLNECVTYVINQLKANGFLTVYYFPRFVYISWDLEEIEKHKKETKAKKAAAGEVRAPALEFKYKPSGKLSVDIGEGP